MFAAILDTCVLWPSLQRDFLLSLAAESLYRPLWSSAILDELAEHEYKKLIDRGGDVPTSTLAATRLIRQMTAAFDGSTGDGWEALEGTFGLPDPDDEHVLAAVVGGAGAIVTENLKDFPASAIPAGIQVIKARDFAHDAVSLSPVTAARALTKISSRYSNPPREPHEVLDIIETRYTMSAAAELIRPVLSRIT